MSDELQGNRFFRFLIGVGRILGAIRQVFRSRYVRYLEAEVHRLQQENGALWRSIWSNAGTRPPADLPPPGQVAPGARLRPNAPEVRGGRSWQQIVRERERKDHEEFVAGVTDAAKRRAEAAGRAPKERPREVQHAAPSPLAESAAGGNGTGTAREPAVTGKPAPGVRE